MDDERTAEGIEHLQRAAKELIAAARSFLDMVEDVVEDPDRFGETATALVGFVRDGLGSSGARPPEGPWVANARTDPTAASHERDNQPDGAEPDAPDTVAAEPEPAAVTEPEGPRRTPRRSPQRVRRIAVD